MTWLTTLTDRFSRLTIVLLGVAGIAAALLVAWQPFVGMALVGGMVIFSVSFRWPSVGLALSFLTLGLGQLVRLPLFGAETNVLPNDLLLPVVLLAWFVRRLINRQPLFPSRPFGRLLLLFGGVLVLSLISARLSGDFTEQQLLVAGLYIVRWVEYVLLFFVARSVARLVALRRWLLLFGGITLALALLGFLQLYLVPDFSAYVPRGWDPHVGRLLSTWFDPNFLGGFFAFSALLFTAFLHDRPEWRWFSLTLAGVGLLALVLTFSRSGYAGFVVGFAVLAILRSRHFLAVGVLAALLVFLFVPRVQERVIGIRSIDETAQLRLVSYQNALTVLRDHPWLGVGYNTYRYVQVDYGFLTDPAEHSAGGSDSSFLTVAVTTGIIGLALFLILIVVVLAEVLQIARRTRDPWLRTFGYGLFAGLVALIIHGQFVNGLLYPHLMEVQWVMLGLLVGASTREGGA